MSPWLWLQIRATKERLGLVPFHSDPAKPWTSIILKKKKNVFSFSTHGAHDTYMYLRLCCWMYTEFICIQGEEASSSHLLWQLGEQLVCRKPLLTPLRSVCVSQWEQDVETFSQLRNNTRLHFEAYYGVQIAAERQTYVPTSKFPRLVETSHRAHCGTHRLRLKLICCRGEHSKSTLPQLLCLYLWWML